MMKIESEKEIYVNKPNDVRNLDLLHIMTAYWLIKSVLGSVRFFKKMNSFVHYGCIQLIKK